MSFLHRCKDRILNFFEDGTRVRWFLLVVLILGLIVQLSGYASSIERSAEPQGVVAATDNDAGVAVGTAVDTQLYNDNGWRPYGPLYYRVVRVLRPWVPLLPSSVNDSPSDANERAHHFLLMFVSALALMGTCLVIGSLVSGDWTWRLLIASVLFPSFLVDKDWTEMIFTAHPDHLFSFFVGLGTLTVWLWLRDEEKLSTARLNGAVWGLAALTKMTVTFFGPAFLFLWASDKPGFAGFKKRVGVFVGSAFLTYMIVGFPQSLMFGGVIDFLLTQNDRNASWGNLQTAGEWFGLFSRQLGLPLCVLAVAALIAPANRHLGQLKARNWWRFAGFVVMTFAFLFVRKITSSHGHYPIPFVVAILVGSALGFNALKMCLPESVARIQKSAWALLAAVGVIAVVQVPTPSSIAEVAASKQTCRPEARATMTKVNAVAETGAHILSDPYVPYARRFNDHPIEMAWDMKVSRIVPGKTKMIALKKAYYRRYLPAEEGGTGKKIRHVEDIEATRSFYRLFFNKDQTVDPNGTTWKRTYSDECGFELWEPSN